MPYIDPDIIKKVKQMDLLTYLQRYEPQELVHVGGNEYTTKAHDSLKISNGKWCWWSRHVGGRSALDYLIKVKDMAFTDAVMLLCDNRVGITSAPMPTTQKAPTKHFELPKANPDNRRVMAYLKGRGIDQDILSYCIQTGQLYQSKKYGNAVFVGFDAKGIPCYATLRGTSYSSTFKLDVLDSDKRHGFCILADHLNRQLHVFESCVDVLSFATLVKMNGQNWRDLSYLSLGGIYLPRKDIAETTLPMALDQYLNEHPQTDTIVLCLDDDDAGRQAAQAISVILEGVCAIENRPPDKGEDYNDMLMIQRKMCRNKRDMVR